MKENSWQFGVTTFAYLKIHCIIRGQMESGGDRFNSSKKKLSYKKLIVELLGDIMREKQQHGKYGIVGCGGL